MVGLSNGMDRDLPHFTSVPAQMEGYELVSVIGEVATIALLEEFAGTRLYVPKQVKDDHPITRAIGPAAAHALCAHYSPSTIRIPLGRELRVQHYRANGWAIAKIAVRLGMTESGVNKLVKRLRQR